MAAETEVKQTTIGSFTTFLKELQTKVLQSNSQYSGPCNGVNGWDFPPLGKEDLAQKLGQLISYIETHQFQESEDLDRVLNASQEGFSKWAETPLNHIYDRNYSRSAICNFLILTADVKDALELYDLGLLTGELQSRILESKRRTEAIELLSLIHISEPTRPY